MGDPALLAEIQQHTQAAGRPEWNKAIAWEDAEQTVAQFYEPYINEQHPCKDSSGAPLWKYESVFYALILENVPLKACAKPQTVNLLNFLEQVFSQDEPDAPP